MGSLNEREASGEPQRRPGARAARGETETADSLGEVEFPVHPATENSHWLRRLIDIATDSLGLYRVSFPPRINCCCLQ